jgi:hypothetical protein
MIGVITDKHTYRPLHPQLDGALVSVALPAFMSHAAYAGVTDREDHHEIIVSEIEEVPGLYGILGSGWPRGRTADMLKGQKKLVAASAAKCGCGHVFLSGSRGSRGSRGQPGSRTTRGRLPRGQPR